MRIPAIPTFIRSGAVSAQIPTLAFIAVAILVPAAFSLIGLGSYPLADTNEGLYAEIAREMAEGGNILIPHLLGVPYIEKPPLWYWLTAGWFHFFGMSETTARLTSALSMTLLAGSLALFLRFLGERYTGMIAALLFATCWPTLLSARTVILDPLFVTLLSVALLFYVQWYLRGRRILLLAGAVLLALATLTKGWVAPVLAVGIVSLFRFFTRDHRAWLGLFDGTALGLFLVVALPWHIAALLSQEGFAWFYFINEHVLRFLGMRQPFDYHVGHAFFYVPWLAGVLLPWAPLLVLLARPVTRLDDISRIIKRFCQAWIAFPLLFFSASVAKAPYYLFIVLPPLALWLAMEIRGLLQRGYKHGSIALRCLAAALGLTVAGLWFISHSGTDDWLSHQGMLTGGMGVILACVAGATSLTLFKRWYKVPSLRYGMLAGVGTLTFPLILLALQVLNTRSADYSSQKIAQVLEQKVNPGTPVFVYRDFEDVFASLPFYLDANVHVIDSVSSDLQFGCRVRKDARSACISSSNFRQQAQGPIAVVVGDKRLNEFLQQFERLRWQFWRSGDKWILIHSPRTMHGYGHT